MSDAAANDRSAPFSSAPDVIFVHGMWHGAWCWNAFIEYLARHGLKGHAIDLPEHGQRYTGIKNLRWMGLRTFVDDFVEQISRFEKTPILIGHSLGCLIIECALPRLRSPPPAVVLLAPTRHRIFRCSVARFSFRHPRQAAKCGLCRSMWPAIETVALCREMLLDDTMSDKDVSQFHEQMRPESFLLMLQLLAGWGPTHHRDPHVRVLVIGGGKDRAVRPSQVRRVARFHSTEAVMFDDMPHDLMLAHGWKRVTRHIVDWLRPNEAGAQAQPRNTT